MKRRLIVFVFVLGFGTYTPAPPPVNFVVDECAPGFVINPPYYNPPCIPLVLPRYRGG